MGYGKVKLYNTSYDDTKVRNNVIRMVKEAFDIESRSNTEDIYGIDLIVTNRENMGIEVEHGHWLGDFWASGYSTKTDYGIRTVNIPIRKEHFWLRGQDTNYLNNWFVRTNDDFTQFILIKSEIIRDNTKNIKTQFQARNADKKETWMTFQRNNVETYNLIDGQWILE